MICSQTSSNEPKQNSFFEKFNLLENWNAIYKL
jgi:hypothetical protein